VKVHSVLLVCSLLSGCEWDGYERKLVGGVQFCVPKENLIEVSGWLLDATKHLPEGGFAYTLSPSSIPSSVGYVPTLDVSSKPMPIYGTVEAVSFRKIPEIPPKDTYYQKMAAKPDVIFETSEEPRVVTVFESSERQFWIVWTIPKEQVLSPASLEKHGRVVARCTAHGNHRYSNNAGRNGSCVRSFNSEGLRIEYSLGSEGLSKVAAIDSAIATQLLAWKCEGK
jgi:hypothetical protein